MKRSNRLKARLREEGYAFGTWIIDSRHSSAIRQIADAGFDFVYIDMEHSSLSLETIGDLCEMARAIDVTPIVRPAELTRESTLRLLEIGTMGLLFHDVDDRAELAQLRDWVAGSKSMLRPDKARQGQDGVAFGIQIETIKGLEAVEDVVSAGGIDFVEIGRGDLATELGFPAQRNHDQVNSAIDRIVAACDHNGVAVGVTCFSAEDAADMARRGVRCISYSADRYILAKAYRDAMQMLGALRSGSRSK